MDGSNSNDFYFKEIHQEDEIACPNSKSEACSIEQKIDKVKEALEKKLNKEDFKLVEELEILYRDSWEIKNFANFSSGFMMGALRMHKFMP